MSTLLDHEQLVLRRGTRSGLPIAVAVHSSVLGQPLGGCRMRPYADWCAAVDDALRLSTAMTYKCAVSGLDHGGAKAVVALGGPLGGPDRRRVFLDVGDVVESMGGAYATGPDIGTTPLDMVTIAERTRHVFCLPAGNGGSGDSSPPTARGVRAAIRATLAHRFGSPDPAGRRCTIIGLGAVGALVAEELADAGAKLTVTDVDPARCGLADRLGAVWRSPVDALHAPADLLIPAAVGGLLTAELVAGLSCAAIVGPANNQLATDPVAELLHARGILWVPDYVASAGGVIHATAVELRRRSPAEALAEVDGIGHTVAAILSAAEHTGTPPHRAALVRAQARLAATGTRVD